MSVESYPSTAVEQAMTVEEVLLRATAGKIMWWQAAETIGISDRQLRRWRKRYEVSGYDGLLDRRRGVPSSKRVPKAQAKQVLDLYREQYLDLNVRHFHEKLSEEHHSRAELHLGEAGPAGGRPGEAEVEARRASQAPATASSAGPDAAY
jgi:transposase-like protein